MAQRLEIHYTPIYGIWLNMTEIELSALARQSLCGRIATFQEVQRRVAEWQEDYDHQQTRIDWHFTTDDARIKLKHLYPQRLTKHYYVARGAKTTREL
ncbi:hypothetical protein KDH_01730 [Dictyobacter sp. S3.2.2.5]|uniref:Tc1-like transposase DDE domain-containing protein n=1 Tax=Dictyobacter halimunensis TaxID=3026934 RepID=A0ABQ6FH45_9CHLR|nr:hypothetical protein KDH_01730 [Dictyobacter sp. S3.2.2.5]